MDDLAINNRNKDDHIQDLRTIFDIIQKYQSKMNLTKSFLGVSSDKVLGFIVTSNGNNLDPDCVKAIREIQLPRNLKELKR